MPGLGVAAIRYHIGVRSSSSARARSQNTEGGGPQAGAAGRFLPVVPAALCCERRGPLACGSSRARGVGAPPLAKTDSGMPGADAGGSCPRSGHGLVVVGAEGSDDAPGRHRSVGAEDVVDERLIHAMMVRRNEPWQGRWVARGVSKRALLPELAVPGKLDDGHHLHPRARPRRKHAVAIDAAEGIEGIVKQSRL